MRRQALISSRMTATAAVAMTDANRPPIPPIKTARSAVTAPWRPSRATRGATLDASGAARRDWDQERGAVRAAIAHGIRGRQERHESRAGGIAALEVERPRERIGHVVGREPQLQAVAFRVPVGGRGDRDFVVVDSAWGGRFRCRNLLERLHCWGDAWQSSV